MAFIDELADFVSVHEGCANCKSDGLVHPYLDAVGYPTQGYGVRVKDMSAPPITKEMAKAVFKVKLQKYVDHALQLSPNLKDYPNKLKAISSFVYNLGPVAYAGSTLRKKVAKEDWDGAAKEFKKWNKAKGRVLAGLTIRRKAEANLFLT